MRRGLDPARCQATIVQERGFSNQCTRKPIITRDGKLYCKIHDPEYIKEKGAKWQAKFDKEWAEKEQRWAWQEARSQAVEGLTLEELKQVTPELIRRALSNETLPT